MITTALSRAAVLFVLLVGAGCATGVSHPDTRPLTGTVAFATRHGRVSTAELQLARTPGAWARGLMGQMTLAPDTGMLFLYPTPTRDGFWMKNTRIPLSVAFWGAARRIVDILDMTPCNRAPCKVYRPRGRYVAALEMHRGWFTEHGVGIGDGVDVRLNSY